MMIRVMLLLGICAAQLPAYAWNTCESYIRRYEVTHGIPAKLLTAISLVESGRKVGRSVVAWPWTINAEGTPYVFATKEEAIATVKRLRNQGISSIDVGCMQVNLKQHPKAFSSLEAAFDPATNIAYAAKFLKAKKENKGSWVSAIAHYHSATPEHHVPYRARVLKTWEKVQLQTLGFHQSFPDVHPIAPEITPSVLDKHTGKIVNKVAAPSGRQIPMVVRFAPYRGFNGGIPGIVSQKTQGNIGPKIIYGRPIKTNAKVIINSMGAFPSQKIMQVDDESVFQGKIIKVSFKQEKHPIQQRSLNKVLGKIRAR